MNSKSPNNEDDHRGTETQRKKDSETRGRGDGGIRPVPPPSILLSLFPPCLRGQRSGNTLIELTDLAATFLEFAGISVPDDWDSRSLVPILHGEEETHRESQVSMLNQKRMIADRQYKLILGEGKETMLFHTLADPWEDHNLAGEQPEQVKRLTEQLRAELGDSEDHG